MFSLKTKYKIKYFQLATIENIKFSLSKKLVYGSFR